MSFGDVFGEGMCFIYKLVLQLLLQNYRYQICVTSHKIALLIATATRTSLVKFSSLFFVSPPENKDGALATLLAFHCTTIVGGLEHVNQVNELQMTHLLKSLFRGLTSPLEDYVAASYMIVAQLTRRTQFSPKIFCGIVDKVAAVC
jgi:uncharacterized membrane protein YjjP (DUF1212 family)